MNILIVSESFTAGGLETHIKTLYEKLRDHNTFTFSFGKYKDSSLLPDAAIATSFFFSPNCTVEEFLNDVDRLTDIVDSKKIDCIVIHPFYSCFPAVIASQLTKTPAVYTYHGTASFTFPNRINEIILFRYALEELISSVFCVNDNAREQILLHCYARCASFIPNSVDSMKYKKHNVVCNRRWAYISRLDEDGEKERTVHLLLSQMDRLGIEKLDIFGDGNCRNRLEEYVKGSGYADKVRFMGFRDNLFQCLDSGYNGIIGMGRVALEGLSMGYPTLLAGYGQLCCIIDKDTFPRLYKRNFVANEILPRENLSQQMEKASSCPEEFDLRKEVIETLDSNIIAARFADELCGLHFSEHANVQRFVEQLRLLSQDEPLFESDDVFSLMTKYIEPYCLNAEIKTLFAVGREKICQKSSTVRHEKEMESLNRAMSGLSDRFDNYASVYEKYAQALEKQVRMQRLLDEYEKERDDLKEKLLDSNREKAELQAKLEGTESKLAGVLLEAEENKQWALSSEAARKTAEKMYLCTREDLRVSTANSAHAAGKLRELSEHKAFRLVHFLFRIKFQLFSDSRKERRSFWKWLFNHFRRKNHSDARYNPLLQVAEHIESNIRFDNRALTFPINQKTDTERMRKLIEDHTGDKVMVYVSTVDWNIPLFQRPQQMALSYAELGILVVYCTLGLESERNLQRVRENCYLLSCERIDEFSAIAKEFGKTVLLTLLSTDVVNSYGLVKHWIQCADITVYDYIDELSEEISGTFPQEMFVKHNTLLSDKSIYVVATADKLYDDAVSMRGSDFHCLNSGNGVDTKHFHYTAERSDLPESISSVVQTGRPIIGYFGALACWFDYKLLEFAALQRPDYEFLLIGARFDQEGSLAVDDISSISNIHYIGVVNYSDLPKVASVFTVATIPFLINDITKATSPIKLFEYMALGKPVVTTAMPECYKYDVVQVSVSKEQFVEMLDSAVELSKDREYISKLEETAEMNSWSNKAKEIIHFIEQ